MFNVFHPDDPIAYRIEPLLNPAYTAATPRLWSTLWTLLELDCARVVPHKGGLRWNHQISSWFTSRSKSPESDLLDLEATWMMVS